MTHLVRLARKLVAGTTGDESNNLEMLGSGVEHSEAPATILNHVGNAWHCWRLRGESDRAFAFRLGLHLQTLAIAIEEDLERVLQAERALRQRSEEHGSINDR